MRHAQLAGVLDRIDHLHEERHTQRQIERRGLRNQVRQRPAVDVFARHEQAAGPLTSVVE
jgi:hypothetical protein